MSAKADGVGLRIEVFERVRVPLASAPAAPVADDGWAQAAALSEAAQKPAPRPAFIPKKKKKIRRLADQKSSVPLPEKKPIPKASQRRGSFVDQPLPERGDFIDHKQFGVCEVTSIDDEGAMVVKTSQGRRRRLVLDVFDVLEARIEDDRIIYPIRPRRT